MTTKINGTNTLASPAITGDDVDTGVVYGNSQVDISIGGASKATVTSNGLGIGTTSPQEILHVKAASEAIGNRDGVIFGSTDSLATDKGLPLVWAAHIGTDADYGIASICGRKENATNDNGAGYLQFGTGTAAGAIEERMRIDSSGKVGIGTTTIGEKLTIGDGDLKFYNSDAANNHRTTFIEFGGNYSRITSESNFGSDGSSAYAAGYKFTTRNYTGSAFETLTPFVIKANGNVGIGTTNPEYLLNVVKGGGDMCRFQQTTNNTSDGYEAILIKHAAALSGQNGIGIRFQNSAGTTVGKINIGQSATSYATSSDYRLKENATAISDGITRLKTLKPYQFNWIAEKGQPKVDGFFAHEVTSAVPEAISGTKDEVDSDKKPVYQSIDQSKLVPLLTAALQEAIAKIETLETKVAALEAA